jgi:uncharacterized membrane protein YbhN (UPF0104 family)
LGAPVSSTQSDQPHPARRIVLIVAVIVVGVSFAELVGLDIRGWLKDVWDTVTGISIEYVVAGVIAKTVQTTATAVGWYGILRSAYGKEVLFRQVLAAYAACVALNSVLPANLGSIVMMVMLTTVIASATFAGILGGFLVQKIFYTVAGTFVYAYLFLSVPGSFDISFSWIKENPWATVTLVVGVVVVVYIVVRVIWPKLLVWWAQAKAGGRILAHPREYLLKVFLPSLVGWLASLCEIGIFLAAYEIPVTFHTIMTVVGGNSIANTVSATPGGAGVQQAFNVASLKDVTDSRTAAAYSVGQQLITTAWSLLFAAVLMIWVFGWGGGKTLIQRSYTEAKEKAAERKAAHA